MRDVTPAARVKSKRGILRRGHGFKNCTREAVISAPEQLNQSPEATGDRGISSVLSALFVVWICWIATTMKALQTWELQAQ